MKNDLMLRNSTVVTARSRGSQLQHNTSPPTPTGAAWLLGLTLILCFQGDALDLYERECTVCFIVYETGSQGPSFLFNQQLVLHWEQWRVCNISEGRHVYWPEASILATDIIKQAVFPIEMARWIVTMAFLVSFVTSNCQTKNNINT